MSDLSNTDRVNKADFTMVEMLSAALNASARTEGKLNVIMEVLAGMQSEANGGDKQSILDDMHKAAMEDASIALTNGLAAILDIRKK